MAVKATRVAEDVLAVLSGGAVAGNTFAITAGQLDHALYKRVNMVLEELGGKWNRKARVHIFDTDPTERLDDVIVTGEIERQADYGFFPTTPAFARRLVELADVRPGMTCLEPSAGTGNIARELAAIVGWDKTDLIEMQPRLCAELRDLTGAGAPEVRCADFLALTPFADYDRIVMNPPFARQQDLAHVRHAWDFLKPGGVLVAVVASGATFRLDRKAVEFRELVDEHGSMERNPSGTFRDSGTLVSTATVQLEKPR